VGEKGEPFSVFSKMSRYHDLMVFGMRSVFEHDVIDDPQDALMQLIKCGVRPLIAAAQGVGPIRKVLIAYSGSTESANSMKQFVQMRLWNDIKIRIVTYEEKRPEARQLLGDAASYCMEYGYEVDTDLVPGHAKKELVKYAEHWGADLVVAGNSARNLLQRQFFGDTAINLIEKSTRPLFLSQ
jgi:nucleotide-binding universal stress UspA family protein